MNDTDKLKRELQEAGRMFAKGYREGVQHTYEYARKKKIANWVNRQLASIENEIKKSQTGQTDNSVENEIKK